MIANHIARSVGPLVQQRINHLGVGQKMQDLPEELWHKSFRYYVKEDSTRKGGPNLRILRLDPDKPSPTVTGYVFNKFVHPVEDRFITVREAARLQGFPDDLPFVGTLTSTQLQVGNAVPVPLAEAVFETILDAARRQGITKPLQGLSLFSGAGGMDIGAERASSRELTIQTKIAVDTWQDACKTLQHHYGGKARVVNEDITAINDPLRFWNEVSNTSELPDIIYGGPPCQSFSQAGKQKGNLDDRGQLVSEFLRFVHALNPPYFLMENVANLRGVGGGALYTQILEQMDGLGYNVTVDILLAAEFGAPQLRNRLLFLGCRKDIGTLPLPTPSYHVNGTLFEKPFVTVSQAFDQLPNARFSTANKEKVQNAASVTASPLFSIPAS